MGLLILWGFGIPAFSIIVVMVLQRLTLYNHRRAAHTLFFFMTGGVLPEFWYWEATAMARKACLAIIVTLVPVTRLRMYLASWLILLFIALQVVVKPWRHGQLSTLETASLLAVFVTFNLLILQSHIDRATQPVLYYAATSATIAVNLLMTLAFVVLIAISGKQTLKRLAYTKPAFGFLRALFEVDPEVERKKTKKLHREVSRVKERIEKLQPREEMVETAWEVLRSIPNGRKDNDTIYTMNRFRQERQFFLVELNHDQTWRDTPTQQDRDVYLRYLQSEALLVEAAKRKITAELLFEGII